MRRGKNIENFLLGSQKNFLVCFEAIFEWKTEGLVDAQLVSDRNGR